jgi:hypothetical protein
MKRPMTNAELISHLMNYSKHGAMMQVIVMEGLHSYCQQVVDAPAGFLGEAGRMFSEDAWRGACQEYLNAYANRDQMLIEDIAAIEDDEEEEEQGDLFEAEKDGLFKVLDHLDDHGWRPIELWDSEEWLVFGDGVTLQAKVKEAAQTDMATLRLRHDDGRIGSIGLVWGNSPIELIADHTTNDGFGEAVQAAQRSVWPNYPEE